MNKTKRKGANSSYFRDIFESIQTLSSGLWLTLKHIFQATKRRNTSYVSDKDYFTQQTGLVTLQYPYESIEIPDNGRYRLHNEIDDCIVCDKCAKVCPVDCITIESLKATEEIGKTSDGTSKRLYAPTFDIDLAKCCYCGLCTTVCPTECLTMTKVYDFSETNVDNFIYKFSDMTPEQAEQKKKEVELANAEKEAAKAAAKAKTAEKGLQEAEQNTETTTQAPKPAFKPKIRTSTITAANPTEAENKAEAIKPAAEEAEPKATKPVFRPKIEPLNSPSEAVPTAPAEETKDNSENKAVGTESEILNEEKTLPTKPVFKPKVRPVIKPSVEADKKDDEEKKTEDQVGPSQEIKPVSTKPVFKPKIRPIKPPGGEAEN